MQKIGFAPCSSRFGPNCLHRRIREELVSSSPPTWFPTVFMSAVGAVFQDPCFAEILGMRVPCMSEGDPLPGSFPKPTENQLDTTTTAILKGLWRVTPSGIQRFAQLPRVANPLFLNLAGRSRFGAVPSCFSFCHQDTYPEDQIRLVAATTPNCPDCASEKLGGRDPT